jgi:predicted Rossmann fold nucleotide-binding protein DprA/Smf involved in DNA uptake
LPSNYKGVIHTDTDGWDGFMIYAVEMGSVAMIYVPSFIKIGSGIQKLIEQGAQTLREHDDLISLFHSFKIRKIS